MRKNSWNWNACPDPPSVMLVDDRAIARAVHEGMMIDYGRQSTERAKRNDIVRFGMCSVSIRKVIFNDPATIVMWSDGSKTVVKCAPKDTYDMEKGLAMAIVKKMAGNDNRFWSDLAEEFWGIFAGGLQGRNNWLKNVFDSGLDQMTYQLGLTSTADEYTSILEQVALATGALTQEEIDDAGSFQKALENGVVDADLLQTSFAAIVESMERYAGLSDEELKAQGFDPKTFHTIWDEYHNINDELQNGTLLLDDYADKMGQLSGREHFYMPSSAVWESVSTAFSTALRLSGASMPLARPSARYTPIS